MGGLLQKKQKTKTKTKTKPIHTDTNSFASRTAVAFNEVIMQHNMVDFLMKHMVPGFVEDDIVLQVVMLFATMANDFKAGPMLGNARLSRMLYDVINGIIVIRGDHI